LRIREGGGGPFWKCRSLTRRPSETIRRAVTGTLAEVFPQVRAHPIHGFSERSQNVIIVAGKSAEKPLSAELLAGTGFKSYLPAESLNCRPGQLLTDDHAPVEWLVAKYLKRD